MTLSGRNPSLGDSPTINLNNYFGGRVIHSYKPTPYFRQPWLKPAVIFFFSLIPLLIVLAIARVVTPIFAEFFAVWSVFLAAVFLGLAYKEGLKRDASIYKGKAFFDKEWRKVTSGIYIFSILSVVCAFFFLFMWVDRAASVILKGDLDDYAIKEAVDSVKSDYVSHNLINRDGKDVLTIKTSWKNKSFNLVWYFSYKMDQSPRFSLNGDRLSLDLGKETFLEARNFDGHKRCFWIKLLESDYGSSIQSVENNFPPEYRFKTWTKGEELWLDLGELVEFDTLSGCDYVDFRREGIPYDVFHNKTAFVAANFQLMNVIHSATEVDSRYRTILLGWGELNKKFQHLVR